MNSNEIQALAKRLLDNFMKKDYGDERDIEEEYFYGRDIEVDGDYILDYSNCRTAKDFEKVDRNMCRKNNSICTLTQEKEAKKVSVIKKFKWLEKHKGIKLPTIEDLAYYLRNDAYQDKVNIYRELIDVLQNEITEYNNSLIEDDFYDFTIPW